jgi:hypothetical protein
MQRRWFPRLLLFWSVADRERWFSPLSGSAEHEVACPRSSIRRAELRVAGCQPNRVQLNLTVLCLDHHSNGLLVSWKLPGSAECPGFATPRFVARTDRAGHRGKWPLYCVRACSFQISANYPGLQLYVATLMHFSGYLVAWTGSNEKRDTLRPPRTNSK